MTKRRSGAIDLQASTKRVPPAVSGKVLDAVDSILSLLVSEPMALDADGMRRANLDTTVRASEVFAEALGSKGTLDLLYGDELTISKGRQRGTYPVRSVETWPGRNKTTYRLVIEIPQGVTI